MEKMNLLELQIIGVRAAVTSVTYTVVLIGKDQCHDKIYSNQIFSCGDYYISMIKRWNS